VLRVIDGDTLEARADIWLGVQLTVHVRLRGIDAPEVHGHCQREKDLAAQATDLLRKETTPLVTLRNISGDKYFGRVEADVTTSPDGLDLAAAMLKSGLARPYDGKKRGDWCDLASLGG
jgi:endonuclease YncB( thermonuclease family)